MEREPESGPCSTEGPRSGTSEDDLVFDAPTVPMLPAAPSGPLEDDDE